MKVPHYALSIPLAALFSGLLQGITGMGGGMLLMLVLPFFFPVPQAAAVSGAICLCLTISLVIRYRKHINYRKALPPTVLYILASAFAIHFAVEADAEKIRKGFGAFLIILSLFLVFKKETNAFSPGPVVSILFVLISGICDGLFSIGSPLMVLYFSSRTGSKEEYLGTTQLLFFFSLLVNTCLRFFQHLVGREHLPFILLGFIGILAGLQIANRFVSRINGSALKKIAYAAIGLSGVFNLFS